MTDTGNIHIFRNTPDPEVLAGNAAQIAAHGPQITTGSDDPLLVEVRADKENGAVRVDVHYEDGRHVHFTVDSIRARNIAALLEQKADDTYAAEFNHMPEPEFVCGQNHNHGNDCYPKYTNDTCPCGGGSAGRCRDCGQPLHNHHDSEFGQLYLCLNDECPLV